MDESKNILELRLRKNIAEGEIRKLLAALPVAEEYHVNRDLLIQGWTLGASFLEKNQQLPDAIIAYNKLRRLVPAKAETLDNLVKVYEKFFLTNKNEFSKDDLSTLRFPLEIIIKYHSIKFQQQEEVTNRGENLLKRINYTLKYDAPIAVETKLTFHVNRIFNAITDDMTLDEVTEELARTLAPLIRKKIEKEKNKTVKTSKKKDK